MINKNKKSDKIIFQNIEFQDVTMTSNHLDDFVKVECK